MPEKLLPELPMAQNWGFVLFLICFLISMQLLGRGRKLFSAMLESLFRRRSRSSIFYENIQRDFSSKFLLTIQTVLLFSVFVFCIVSHNADELLSVSQFFEMISITSAVFGCFVVLKFVLNFVMGAIFFRNDQVNLFHQALFSIVSLLGLLIFIPTLLMFYVEEAYTICLYFNIICFVLVELLITYKIFTTFFNKAYFIFYFIAYFCIMEVVPLYIAYKTLLELFLNIL
ncbi:hypothetical protein SAMD00024442_4_64 [Candidatus Symbiothrix dinenymphae]|nr:hypothetical protein SAMD00024442_4_64 [Candidatus Symbiothrix dinenymphae]